MNHQIKGREEQKWTDVKCMLVIAFLLRNQRSLLVLRLDGPPGKSFIIHPSTLSTTQSHRKKFQNTSKSLWMLIELSNYFQKKKMQLFSIKMPKIPWLQPLLVYHLPRYNFSTIILHFMSKNQLSLSSCFQRKEIRSKTIP